MDDEEDFIYLGKEDMKFRDGLLQAGQNHRRAFIGPTEAGEPVKLKDAWLEIRLGPTHLCNKWDYISAILNVVLFFFNGHCVKKAVGSTGAEGAAAPVNDSQMVCTSKYIFKEWLKISKPEQILSQLHTVQSCFDTIKFHECGT